VVRRGEEKPKENYDRLELKVTEAARGGGGGWGGGGGESMKG